MKLLHLDSSILGNESASRAMSAAAVERLRADDPALEVAYRDLCDDPLSHLTVDGLGGAEAEAVLQQFLDADVVVIGVGLYNFTVPTQLKSWIDRILIAGRTFRYTAQGAEGIAGGKRVVVALARGGIYGGDSPYATLEHAETLLRGTFNFIGIANPEFIVAEGLALGDEARRASLDAALAHAGRLEPSRLGGWPAAPTHGTA